MAIGELPQVKPVVPYLWGHTEMISLPEGCSSLTGSPTLVSLALRQCPTNSGPLSKQGGPACMCKGGMPTSRAQTCQKLQHGPVAGLGAKPSPSPLDRAVLFLVQPCFSKEIWDHGVVCSLLEEGLVGNVSLCTKMDVPCPFSEPQKQRAPAPRSAWGNTSAACSL